MPVNPSCPLSPVDEMKADDIDRPLAGNSGAMDQTIATASQSIWPTDTNLIHVPGTQIKLSNQSLLLKVICRDTFNNVRRVLLFDSAFPAPNALPAMVRMCLTKAIRDCTVRGGGYNASAACVHQRLLTDVDYEAKLARLVSTIPLSIT